MELVSRNITDKAEELTSMRYTEKAPDFGYSKCNSVLINHTNKTFWFTNREQGEHVLKFS